MWSVSDFKNTDVILIHIARNGITKEILIKAAEFGQTRCIELCIANGYDIPKCNKPSYLQIHKPVLVYYHTRIVRFRTTTRFIFGVLKRTRFDLPVLKRAIWAERYKI